MKKKMISLTLVMALLCAMVLGVHADTPTYVASIGETGYETLAAAVAAATDGETVDLMADTDIRESSVTVTEDITLDLNGYKITATNASGQHIKVASGAKLTLKDSGTTGEITIVDGGSNYGGVHVEGEFVMESGYINGLGGDGQQTINAVSVSSGGSATINGGKIEADQSSVCNLNGNGGYSLIVVNGGNIGSIYSTYTASPAGHDVVVTGGTIADITIKSSELAKTAGIVPEMTITGGKIDSVNFAMYGSVAVSSSYFVYGITGGEFANAPTAGIAAGYVVSDTPTDGYYTIVDQVTDTVTGALDDVASFTPETAETNKATINTAAGEVAAIPKEDLVDHVDDVNTLDTLFVAANGDLTVDSNFITAGAGSDGIITGVEVAGLGLAVYGDGTTIETATTLTLEVAQTDASANEAVDFSFTAVPKVKVGSAAATKVENDELNTPVTFKVYLPDSFEGNRATVKHIYSDGTGFENYDLSVLTDGTGKYIQITVTQFSIFEVAGYTYTAPPVVTPKYTAEFAEMVNGDAYVNVIRASANSTVTITATADEGYEVDAVVVRDASGKLVAITDLGNGSYTFKQPASTATITVTFVAADDAVAENPFTDVAENIWYYDAVLWAAANDVAVGTDGSFNPNAQCSRAQAVTFLWNAAGAPEMTGEIAFTDVAEDAWYYDAVLWAVENHVTAGTDDNTFSPDAACSRGQIITLLFNMVGNEVDATIDFTDVAEDAWYAEAVRWAVSERVAEGTGDNAFSPDAICTRAEIVAFIYRYFGA